MKSIWAHRVSRVLSGSIPLVVTLLLVIASALPWHLPLFVEGTPALAVAAVFHWTINRPDCLPLAATFCIGLLQDLLTGTPPGMTALMLLAVQGFVASQRTFFHGKPFLVVWWGFALVMPAAGLMSWGVASAYFQAIVPPLPIIVQAVLTILFFPVLAAFFNRVGALIAHPAG